MSDLLSLTILCLMPIIAYLFSLTNLTNFLPQLIATVSIIFIIFQKYKLPSINIIALIISLIVFTSGGVSSTFFFLIYFLIFVSALTLHPLSSILFSLTLILLLAQSLNSLLSLIPIVALIFISPIVWYVGGQKETIVKDETDFQFWLNLKFKTGISSIIDSASQAQSTPLTISQKNHLKKIKDTSKYLLHSAEKLSDEI